MYTRVIQFPLKAESISEAINYFQDTVGPALKELDGFKSARMLTNSTTNRGQMATVWDSEAQRQAAESSGFLTGILKQMGSYFDGPPSVDYYEVSVQVE